MLSKDKKDNVISVSRRSDRVMSIKLGLEDTQVGCPKVEKKCFWGHMDQKFSATLEGERVIVGEDLNGHLMAWC